MLPPWIIVNVFSFILTVLHSSSLACTHFCIITQGPLAIAFPYFLKD